MKNIARFIGVAMVLGLVAGAVAPAQAATVADLQAMIAQLQAQLAALSGSSTTATATFTTDLKVGSKGSDVVALQNFLIAKGYLASGLNSGYFGGLTKAALVKYQMAKAITPASGYFGPKTRASVNAEGSVSTGTTGTTTGTTTTTSSTGITTPGAEGTLTAESSTSGLVSTAYEGESGDAVLGMKLTAKNSDISVQRIKLDLGTSTKIYNKIYKTLKVTDGSNTLASVDLNSDTVVKDSGEYYVTITGFNFVIPKGSNKTLWIKADVYSSIDSSDLASYTLTVPANGVRGVDGAGVDQYAPANSFSRSTTINSSLVDSATLSLAANANTPDAAEVVAADGSNNDQKDMVSTLSFDLRAEKDSVKVTDLVATTTKSGSGAATAQTAYLYDGSTQIASAAINSNGAATFNDIDYVIAKDTTKTFTVKVDIRSANGNTATFTGSVAAAGITAENSNGDSVTPSGSATGNSITVRNVGPEITLVSKSISKSATASQNNTSTSTVTAVFNLKIKAVGGDISFGTQSASSTFNLAIYKGGVKTTLAVASSTSFQLPSSGVVTSGIAASEAFELQKNNEVTIPVTFYFEGRTAAAALLSGDVYAAGLESVNWAKTSALSTTNTTNFMAGNTDWRTDTVQLP